MIALLAKVFRLLRNEVARQDAKARRKAREARRRG